MSLRLAAGGAAMVAALEQAVKAIVRADVPEGSTRELLPGIDLVHTKNTGVSFGFLNDAPPWAVGLISAVAMVAVVFVLVRSIPGRAGRVAIALIVGGAIGNLIDRIARGSVTDFLDLPLIPPCNLADVAITFGVVAIVVGVVASEAHERAQSRNVSA